MMVNHSDEDGTSHCPLCNDKGVVPLSTACQVEAVTRSGVNGEHLGEAWATCPRCQDKTKDVSGATIFDLNL